MLRASAVCEQAGVPSSSLVCEGFIGQAAATTIGLGMKLPVAFVPGHTGAQSADVLRRNILDVTLNDVIANLTGEQSTGTETAEPRARDIVFSGSFTDVNRTFIEREWSDGLPIIPPTRELVDAFLRHTERDADEERRSAAHQCLRLRPQRNPGIPRWQEDPLTFPVAPFSRGIFLSGPAPKSQYREDACDIC